MKLSTKLLKLSFAMICICFAIGCTQTDESVNGSMQGYGYVQFKLFKKATRATDELEYLRDARKITLTLIKDNQAINQTVLVEEADESISEFGLRTERLQLITGGYTLAGYIIYNSIDEPILTGAPESTMNINVEQSKLLVQPLEIKTVLRGKIQFRITKDLSEATPKSRVSQSEETRDFTFDEIVKMDITIRNQDNNRSFSPKNLKVEYIRDDKGSSYLKCDSLMEVEAGTYKLESYTMWDGSSRPLGTADTKADNIIYEIPDNSLCKADVPVLINPTALYILDYIALKKIYDDMDGKNWSWLLDGFPTGAKWNFDKDVDLWYEQPGVLIHTNGRVAALNLGALNPQGPLSPAIGQLTAMVDLMLGTHNDKVPESNNTATSSYSAWSRLLKGQYLSSHRREVFAEIAKSRRDSVKGSELFRRNTKKAEAISYWSTRTKRANSSLKTEEARPYEDVPAGELTNGITSLPKEIGLLINLERLFIANGKITEIPVEIKNCTQLTDLEIYNCREMKKFPMAITEIPGLIQLNFASNVQMPSAEMERGLDALFNGASMEKLQIMYLNHNNINEFPESAKNLKKLSMLELSSCKLTKIHPMVPVSPVQIFLDHNQLTSLPKNFINYADVEEFSVTHNNLTEFPNIFSAESKLYLDNVDFSYNKIKTIAGYDNVTQELVPDKDGELYKGINATTLNMTGNMINGGFPAAFSLTKSEIAQINFCYNNLDSIGAKGLKGLTYTAALDFSSNNIEEVPSIKNLVLGIEMPFLTGIDVSYNRFKKFPELLFNGAGINTFFFSGQREEANGQSYACFTTWPDGIEQYAGLKVLKMDYNDIGDVATFPTGLNFLSIVGNDNISITIPQPICDRIPTGSFGFEYWTTQTGIKGCPALGIE